MVGSPEEYYIIVAIIDLIEFMFRLNKNGMIDTTKFGFAGRATQEQ
jgi:hypothetical protein